MAAAPHYLPHYKSNKRSWEEGEIALKKVSGVYLKEPELLTQFDPDRNEFTN